jgi:hypothetical protein
MVDFNVLLPVGAGLVRSIFGWFENAIQDGKISAFEWEQLGSTIIRVGVIGVAAAYGLNLDWVQASACALGADILLQTVKKFKPNLVQN